MPTRACIDTSATIAWLKAQRDASHMAVEPIDWVRCAHWRLRDGVLEHDTGGFFSVVGAVARSNLPELDSLSLPMIDQPEIGILGFLLRPEAGGFSWLLQAKGEPGNVDVVQVAPSVQATFSNYTRRHGGAATEFLDYVVCEGDAPGRLVDVRQSEQGSMFLDKFNRNIAVLTAHDGPVAPSDLWRWTSSDDVRGLLHQDYIVNTDARSVLVTTPWRYLGRDGEPFSHPVDTWTEALAHSYAHASPQHALSVLETERARITLRASRTGLDSLPDCAITAQEITCTAGRHARRVRPYAIIAPNREIGAWSQPLVSRDWTGEVAHLICALRGDVLRFYLRVSAEIGFAEKAQFGPSMQSDAFTAPAPWIAQALAHPLSVVRASILQSDEGGRFMRCITRYQIVQIPADAAADADGVWASLGDLEQLAAMGGVLTNEARSAASLLLAWA